MQKAVLLLLPLATLGCTSTLEQVNAVLAAGSGGSPVGAGTGALFRMTDQQKESLKNTIIAGARSGNPQQNLAIKESSGIIYKFIATESCLASYNASMLNVYAAPGKRFPDFGYNSPALLMRYHQKSGCTTVTRIHGWNMPARNALRFEVVYSSELSGESVEANHEIIRQPSGEWLFSN